jgi:hypothetical protein
MQQEFLLNAILLTAMALCAGAALVLSFQQWKDWKPRRVDPGLPHQASHSAQIRDFLAKAVDRPGRNTALRPIDKPGRNTAFALICVLFFCWIAWPYYAAYDLATALRDGDSIALENRVAWDSVRQGLRADLNAFLLQGVGSDSGAGSGLAAILGPAIINQMIEGYVTPQGLATLMRPSNAASTSERSDASRQVRHLDFSRLKYAFFSGGPLTFKVELENEKNDRSPFALIFKWSGNWKLTRLILPAGTFPDHKR